MISHHTAAAAGHGGHGRRQVPRGRGPVQRRLVPPPPPPPPPATPAGLFFRSAFACSVRCAGDCTSANEGSQACLSRACSRTKSSAACAHRNASLHLSYDRRAQSRIPSADVPKAAPTHVSTCPRAQTDCFCAQGAHRRRQRRRDQRARGPRRAARIAIANSRPNSSSHPSSQTVV